MKFLGIFLFLLSPILFAQSPEKLPRVIEVEEKLRDEASRYFTRRFPGEPFYVRVDVTPLRRITKGSEKAESLPYFDSVSEEEMDEWDDPTTPMSFLRHRVVKVFLEISVPEKFTDEKIKEIKDELNIYLKLLSYRDEVRVERKLKAPDTAILPPFFYPVTAGILISLLLLAGLLRWSFGGKKETPSPAREIASPVAQPVPREGNRTAARTSADVRGDVTFHDPLKIMDIVQLKIGIIRESKTFPTLKDILTLTALSEHSPARLGALIHSFPMEWQKEIFGIGKGEAWLEAYAQPGGIDHEVLTILDQLTRQRSFVSGGREKEDLMIQLWRMGEKSVPFLRKLEQNEAFSILNLLPKSMSLSLAKKAFPGAWARLLDTRSVNLEMPADFFRGWLAETLLILPRSEWKTLEGYRKDREILSYLDQVSIDEERDIYESLNPDSFVFEVRVPFYRIFDLNETEFTALVAKFPLEKWALVVMNSSRNYGKRVSDALEDKRKMVFSNHLRALDASFGKEEQLSWRRTIAAAAQELHPETFNSRIQHSQAEGPEDHAKTA